MNLKYHMKYLQDTINNIIKSKVERGNGEEVFDPNFVKPVIDRFKNALTKFNNASFVLTCSTYD